MFHDKVNYFDFSNIFIPASNYLQIFSDYSQKHLTRRLSNTAMIVAGTSPFPENFRNWNLKSRGILITFDEYQVAPYVDGPQTILIPYSVLKPVISHHSPVWSCIHHRKKCSGNNLLTGGFIDEA